MSSDLLNMKQFGTLDQDSVSLSRNSEVPFYFTNNSFENLLVISTESLIWNGVFDASYLGEYSVKCYKENRNDCLIFRVQSQLNHGTIYVKFRDEDPYFPNYRIINESSCNLRVQQYLPYQSYDFEVFENKKWPWVTISSNLSINWAWDELTCNNPFILCILLQDAVEFVPFDQLGYKSYINNINLGLRYSISVRFYFYILSISILVLMDLLKY